MVQVNNYTGFETQDALEALGVSGTPTYSTTTVRTGGAALELGASDVYDLPWLETGVSDAGTGKVIFFAFNTAAAGEFTFPAENAAGSQCVAVTLDPS